LRFDVALLAQRVIGATDWLRQQADTRDLRVGYVGASTGAAAALMAAAARPSVVGAIVSRGGRSDLARSALQLVEAPTLFLVGGADEVVLGLTRAAMAEMRGEVALSVIPRAGHVFDEPMTMEDAASQTVDWFRRWLHPV
jgi:dienelactone hydrolase